MKKIVKIIANSLLPVTLVTSFVPLVSCSQNTTWKFKVEEESNFHHIKLVATTNQLTDAGLEYGDSVNVNCSNGFNVNDVPFLTGYFVKHGDWVLCAYNGGNQPLLACSWRNGWVKSGLKADDEITITLNKKGNHKDLQDNLNLKLVERTESTTDEQWANFRDPSKQSTDNKLVSDLLYRGFSPAYKSSSYGEKRETVNTVCQNNNIVYDIDLSDDKERIESHLKDTTSEQLKWFKNVYNTNQILYVKMGVDFQSDEFKGQMKQVMLKINELLESNKKMLIHCDEGKDRTGYVFMLLEALVGWTDDEICQDYMTTFKNFYGVTKESTQYEYVKKVYYEGTKEEFTQHADPLAANKIQSGAINYLLECGLTSEQIGELQNNLTKK